MFYLATLFALILDQASKYFVKSGFWVSSRQFVISDWLYFEQAHNTGVAFSMPLEGLPLQIITILIIAGLCYYFFRHEEYRDRAITQLAYGAIVGSALSHAYERIAIGHVVDFIWVKYFAIFNFADIFITIGAILLVLLHLGIWKTRK